MHKLNNRPPNKGTDSQPQTPDGSLRSSARRLRAALAFNTLSGRFLAIALLLLGLLVILAWLVGARVQRASSENTVNIEERHQIYTMSRDMADEIWAADELLQSHMLVPSRDAPGQYAGLLDHLAQDTEMLCATSWLRGQPGLPERCTAMLAALRAVKADGLQLMAMRINPEQLYPGIAVMLGRMQEPAVLFMSEASVGIDQGYEYYTSPGQREALRHFSDALYAWSRMIGAFRLYVSNRFGIFDSSPERAMKNQEAMVTNYSERVMANLAVLDRLDKKGQLEIQQSAALESMHDRFRDWHDGWTSARHLWSSDRWRLDTPMMRDHIRPHINLIWTTVRDIEKQISAHSAQDLALMAGLAGNVSQALWLQVLAGVFTVGIALLLFEAQIRRPIARVVKALKAEAAGEKNIVVPETRLVETRELVQAFDHMRREVHSREARLEAVLHYAAEAIITIDERGLIESFNPAAERLFGYGAAEVLGNNVDLLMPEPQHSAHDGYLQHYLGAGEKRAIGQAREVEALHKDGRLFPVEINVSEMWVDGRRLFTGMLADISERKAMLEQLELTLAQLNTREQRLHTILNNTAEGIITFDEWGMIEGFSQSAEKLFGWAEDEVSGTSIAQLISPETREIRDDYLEHFMRAEIQRLIGHEGELAGRHKDGSSFPMAIKISGMWLENRQKYIAMVSNISERKALIENLRKLAEHDGLTGLYNRSYFHGELERVVERVHRSEVSNCALLYIDLDHFKYVNDTLGHAAGDKLLIEVANILTRRARKSDLVARLGGDEFTVLLYDTDPKLVENVADSFRRQLADYSFSFEGKSATIGCSIGVAMIEPAVASPTETMSRADLACHLAKRGGRNQVHVFAPEDAKNVTTMTLDMGWSRRIREAIEHNRFTLACQPIVSTRTRTISTYEVLIRMQDDNGEHIMPGGFLPTAERFGLSLDIDLWVIENAINALAGLRATSPALNYTINLSAQTLNSPMVCDIIQEKISACGLDAAALIFEVTETVAISDMSAAVTLLTRLRALGCRTALDDFGSGMSSFAYLKELPVDIVKIDGRFVKHIATNPVDQAMVRAMNDIAHALGKETIAEFVENEAAFQMLVELGVDYGQGYHLGRPETIAPSTVYTVRAGGVRRH